MIEIIQNLKGHSGCQVDLCRCGSEYFVRKKSSSVLYNERLKKQIEKQINMSDIIRVPQVLSIGIERELVFFDMEFVNGADFKARCFGEPAYWVYDFIDRLISIFDKFEVTKRKKSNINALLVDKSLLTCERIEEHAKFAEVGLALSGTLAVLRSACWDAVPETRCHGDLTLENMIFNADNSIIFIDMLDGDIETFWLDVAKLLFDLEIGWSLRELLWSSNRVPEAQIAKLFSRHIYEEIVFRLEQNHRSIFKYLNQMKTLQAARIIPYTNDDVTLKKLVQYLSIMNPN